MGRANFMVVNKDGFDTHIELDAALTAEECQRFLKNIGVTLGWLRDEGFTPRDRMPGNAPAETGEAVATNERCPCGALMSLREGTAKDGGRWQGWFCPKSKGRGDANHPVKWVDDEAS